MKVERIVRCSALSALIILIGIGLSSCSDKPRNHSFYAHGSYRCYYQNARSGKTYKAVAKNQEDAIDAAEDKCILGTGHDTDQCHLIDCVFK